MEGIVEVPKRKRSAKRREEMLDRVSPLIEPEFIARSVYPSTTEPFIGISTVPKCETEVLANRGRGRAVVRYRFEDGQTVIGKIYSDDRGLHCYDVLTALSKDGFGDGGPNRVPRALAYLPVHKVVLMTEVNGSSFKSWVDEAETIDTETLARKMKQAARWLVALHSSSCRVGRPQSLCESADLFKILRGLAKAAAESPKHERERMIETIKTLCRLGQNCEDNAPLVQTHGRYHLEEIFINGDTVTSVDFDGSVPADPAKDLAKFLTVSAGRILKRTGNPDEARLASRAFLDEYLSHLPDHATNLSFYWGTLLLQDLLDDLSSYEVHARGRKQDRFESYASQLELQAKELDAVLAGDWHIDG